jgi:hypothetical protein
MKYTFREIRVTSTLEQPVTETNENDEQEPLPPSSFVTAKKLGLEVSKIMITPIFALCSALSLPIVMILAQQEFSPDRTLSLEQKILLPLVPYLILVSLRTWLLWNSIGQRLNGKPDTEIMASDEHFTDEPMHVLAVCLANTSSFTQALLAGFLISNKLQPAVKWGFGIILGMANYPVDLVTQGVDAFRKHSESKQNHGQHIHPFFKQKYIRQWITPYSKNLGIVIREALPVISGIIHSKTTIQALNSYLSMRLSSPALTIIKLPTFMMVYWATAYATRFDLVQFKENIKASGQDFVVENCLSQSAKTPIRICGQITSGQILPELLKLSKMSLSSAVNTTLLFYACGQVITLQQALHQYISSSNASAIHSGQEGLMATYLFGENQALHLAPKLEIGVTCIAISLGVLGTFAKSATIHNHARSTEITHRIAVASDNAMPSPSPI